MASDRPSKTAPTCRHTFDSAIDLFLKLAKDQQHNGHLSYETLELIAKSIKTDPQIEDKYCSFLFQNCAAQMRMSLRSSPRVNVYGRIIAEPFEHLLKSDQPVIVNSQLANFFYAIEVILGRANYEKFMERSVQLMDKITKETGDTFTYEALYSHPKCWEIRWDSFMALAAFFSKFELRKDWYNRIMHSQPETPGTGQSPYPFSDFHFKSQMMCIFSAFTNFSDEDQKRFEERYSKTERKAFSAFLANVASIEEDV